MRKRHDWAHTVEETIERLRWNLDKIEAALPQDLETARAILDYEKNTITHCYDRVIEMQRGED